MNEFEQNFASEYAKLNDEQKQAVDQIDGPVIVLAGPGTGKTQLLSMRVANILRKTDANPQNILFLSGLSLNCANSTLNRLQIYWQIVKSARQGIIIWQITQNITNDFRLL